MNKMCSSEWILGIKTQQAFLIMQWYSKRGPQATTTSSITRELDKNANCWASSQLLNHKLWGWSSETSVLTSSPCDSDAH